MGFLTRETIENSIYPKIYLLGLMIILEIVFKVLLKYSKIRSISSCLNLLTRLV